MLQKNKRSLCDRNRRSLFYKTCVHYFTKTKQERGCGPEHQEVAKTLTKMGNANGDLSDAARQRELLQRALAIEEREYRPEHQEMASTLTILGNANGDLSNADGDLWEAAELLERALRIEDQQLGAEHLERALRSETERPLMSCGSVGKTRVSCGSGWRLLPSAIIAK